MNNILKAEYKRLFKSVIFYIGFVGVVLSVWFFYQSNINALKWSRFAATNEHYIEYVNKRASMSDDEAKALGRIFIMDFCDETNFKISNSLIMELDVEGIDELAGVITMESSYLFSPMVRTFNTLTYIILLVLVLFGISRHQSGSIRRDIIGGKSRISVYFAEVVVNLSIMLMYTLFNLILVLILALYFKTPDFTAMITAGTVLSVVSLLVFITVFVTTIVLCIQNTGVSTIVTLVAFIIPLLLGTSIVAFGLYIDPDEVSMDKTEENEEIEDQNMGDEEIIEEDMYWEATYWINSYDADLNRIEGIILSEDNLMEATHGKFEDEFKTRMDFSFGEVSITFNIISLLNPMENLMPFSFMLVSEELTDKFENRLLLNSVATFAEVAIITAAGAYIFNRKELN